MPLPTPSRGEAIIEGQFTELLHKLDKELLPLFRTGELSREAVIGAVDGTKHKILKKIAENREASRVQKAGRSGLEEKNAHEESTHQLRVSTAKQQERLPREEE